MTDNISQARRYREMVRVDFWRGRASPDQASDVIFRQYLETKYEEAKSRLLKLIRENAPESAVKAEKNGLFVISVGLFTFGCLDVAQDILDNIPGGRANINRLAWVLNVLLPIPKGLDVLKEPTSVREWLNVKRSRLKWDESLEKYILETSEI